MTPFTPANPLEQVLLAAQAGKAPPSQLFEALCSSQVMVMADQPLGAQGEWVEGSQLLVLESEAGAPVVAVFSAPERAAMWRDIATAFSHPLLVEFRWVLGGVVNDVGIALNPGSEVGVELTPVMVKKLQHTIGIQQH